eukprot:8851112-Pyramimonas_sp.AAC.1
MAMRRRAPSHDGGVVNVQLQSGGAWSAECLGGASREAAEAAVDQGVGLPSKPQYAPDYECRRLRPVEPIHCRA